ncbi:LysE family translocator, partial [Billgrantia desiderata]
MIGPEFLALLLITIITILTPGPDFLVIVKNTLVRSRRAGIYTALGVSTAIWFHIAYSITFVNYITGASDRVFEIVRILGGMYLLWLGSKALLASSNSCIRIENNE